MIPVGACSLVRPWLFGKCKSLIVGFLSEPNLNDFIRQMDRKVITYICYFLGGLAGLYGSYGFIYHLVTDFGVERLILAPVILPLYNLPAIILVWIGFQLSK